VYCLTQQFKSIISILVVALAQLANTLIQWTTFYSRKVIISYPT